MKLNARSILLLKIQKIIFLVLFACVIGASAWLTDHYTWQFDLTANKRHSISQTSKDLLKKLDGDIVLHAYTTDDVTSKAVDEIISRYQREKSNFTVRHLHPDINIKQAEKDGITMNKPYAFVMYYGERMEHIKSLSEQSITNALLRLSQPKNRNITFVSGHGERSFDTDSTSDYNTLTSKLKDMGFKLNKVNLLEQGIPDDTRVLVIASPRNAYLPGELDVINTFIDRGGNLLWLTEPGDLEGLKPLATSFGLQLQDGVIVDNNTDLRKTLNIQNPSFIPVTQYYPHEITQSIRYNTLFPTARGISPLTDKTTVNHWQAQALFGSLPKSWTEVGPLDQGTVNFDSESGDVAGPITIAVAMVRDLTNKQPDDTSSKINAGQRAVIIGDSDFLSDRYIGVGANMNLGLNIVNWLVSGKDSVAIASLTSPDTHLELTDTQLGIIAFGFFLILPLSLIVLGIIIWRRRSKR